MGENEYALKIDTETRQDDETQTPSILSIRMGNAFFFCSVKDFQKALGAWGASELAFLVNLKPNGGKKCSSVPRANPAPENPSGCQEQSPS